MLPPLDRRRFAACMAAGFAAGLLPARAAGPPRYLGDMHSHFHQFRQHLLDRDMGRHLRETGTTLMAWAIVDDAPWIGSGPSGIVQKATPGRGELWPYFQERAAASKSRLAAWGIPLVLTADDVDRALRGEAHVVLASESANFLEGDVSRLAAAHALGLRHTQIVHYIESPLGDLQTTPPRHGGLSQAGRRMVAECRRLGILVDLAHCTESGVDAAFDTSDAAMVWSHSWVRGSPSSWREPGYVARALSRDYAKKIAARGGVVGLWSVSNRSRAYPLRDAGDYADEILRMVDLVGPEHVGFGTDMEGAGDKPVMYDYADLRGVADRLVARGLAERDLQAIFIGNYARVLKQAMPARESRT